MPERIGVPENVSKKFARQQIEEALIEHEQPYRDEVSPELAETFEIETSNEPLHRQDVEKEIVQFIDQRFSALLPALIDQNLNHSELIKRLCITNEDIGLLGANYYIREENGEQKIFKTDEYSPDRQEVSSQEVGVNDLISLLYAKESIRVDSRRTLGTKSKSFGLPHRFYLRSKDRYLCNNDFGMRVWNEEEKRMDDGDVTNVVPFIQTIKKEVDRMCENLSILSSEACAKNYSDLEQSALQEAGVEYLDWEQRRSLERKAREMTTTQLSRQFEEYPKDKTVVMTAVSGRKAMSHLHFNFDKVAKKYGFLTADPLSDYENFDKNSSKLERLFRKPTDAEKVGTSLSFVYADLYKKPVIVGDNFNKDSLVAEATVGVHNILTNRAIQQEPEAVRGVYERSCSRRGQESPHFYSDYAIYDLIKKLGPEFAGEFLDNDGRNIKEQLVGLSYLEDIDYDITQFKPTELRKQTHEAYKLSRARVWRYIEEREQSTIEALRARSEEPKSKEPWLKVLGKKKSRDLYREGKRMYWLAQQVFMHSPQHTETDRFYNHDECIQWDRYDLTKTNVPDERLNEYLTKNINLIAALLNQETQQPSASETTGSVATLGLIVQALEGGQDLRGVALAHDKQRYLEGITKGSTLNDLEFALADWPAEWKSAITPQEIELYYEYADDYVILDPNGLGKYAAWRSSPSGREWANVFKEEPKQKSDLDFRICIGNQTDEVRGWYKEAAEYIGNEFMQSYLLRFNSTRGADRRMANWHDVLFWVPNIRKLEAKDAKSIISSIETVDDNQEFLNFLPRYSQNRDPLSTQGPIQSLRELKKRVFAIESNIDLTQFPAQVIDIISAPGFNLAALESMCRRADFQDLLEGELDKEQPFKPHTRIFAGRYLTESLREGLGSMKQKIKGTAKDTKGLFHSLGQLIKGRKIGEKPMQVTDLLDAVPLDLEEDIIRLLQDQRVDIGPTVEAQIHAKSDPEGWVCGNYTDCCMPFGDYKNDDYMFNRSAQYFTIKYNGRIVAQSVVADSRDERNGSDVVILDNIEVANNYKNLTPLLARVYQTFWTEYTSKPVKVGTGYSDLTPPGAKLEPNTYKPKTPLQYSDAAGGQIYDLPKMRGVESLDQIVTFANLSERDADLIAKMEAEVYPGEMAQGKAHIMETIQKQRELDVPGAASSFVMRQGDEPAGYLLMIPEESEIVSGQTVAHIHDMAVLPKFQGTGLARKMIERVLDVATAYGVSIEAEARASTSYALLMNERMRSWFESRGFHLSHNEKLPKYLGNEDFYRVRFENRQQVGE